MNVVFLIFISRIFCQRVTYKAFLSSHPSISVVKYRNRRKDECDEKIMVMDQSFDWLFHHTTCGCEYKKDNHAYQMH